MVCSVATNTFRESCLLLRSDSRIIRAWPQRNGLQSVLDCARPAMVAEYWQNRRCRSQQYLMIGIPSLPEGAPRPSHFDRIDNKTAHCVSGSNLSPGDHPVGLAIPHPHPSLPGAFFHLVNLPTPRRRMVYEQSTGQGSDATRLAEISRRTLDKVLLEKRKLTDREIVILATLSRAEVSRFCLVTTSARSMTRSFRV